MKNKNQKTLQQIAHLQNAVISTSQQKKVKGGDVIVEDVFGF